MGGIFGLLFAIFTPYGAGFDEETHLVRVYDLARGYLLPNQSGPSNTYTWDAFYRLSYQRRYMRTPAWDLFQPPLSEARGDRINLIDALTRSIYNPLSLTPQALMAGVVWRIFDLPVISGAIMIRIAGLAMYLIITFLAMSLMPSGKWILLVCALAPGVMYQAATVNTDGFSNAISFLFLALFLASHLAENSRRRAMIGWLGAVILLVGCSKPGAVFILALLLFLPPDLARKQRVFLWLMALVSVTIHIAWLVAAADGSHLGAGGGQSMSAQAAQLLADPTGAMAVFLSRLPAAIPVWLRDWAAAYGHWDGNVPPWTWWLFAAALISALLIEPKPAWFSPRIRIGLLISFLLGAGFSMGAYFAGNYDPAGSVDLGRQGRYLGPWLPLLFIALSGWRPPHASLARRLQWVSGIGVAGSLIWFGLGGYAAYYTWCGEALWSANSCSQPVYKNLDRDNLPLRELSAGQGLTQDFLARCPSVSGVQILVQQTERPAVLDLRIQGEGDVPADAVQVAIPAGGKRGYYGYELAAPVHALDQLLTLTVRVVDGTGNFPWQEGDSYYPDGGATVLGKELPGDFIFHYLCSSGPR